MSRSCVSRCSRSWRTRSKSASVSDGPRDHVGEQRAAPRPAKRLSAVTRQQRRVGPDVGVELRAEARQRLVHLDRRAAAAALVEHVDGQRRQTFLAGRIVGRAAPQQQHERHDRNRRVARRSRRAGRSAASTSRSAGKRTGAVGPGSGSRERTGLAPRRSSTTDRRRRVRQAPASARPRGTTLSATRRRVIEVAARPPACSDAVVTVLIARRDRGRRSRDRRGTCCRRSADRTCRRSRRPSAAGT